jgi:multidrug resistance efflux pump
LPAPRAGVDRQTADRQRAEAVLAQARIDYRRVEDLAARNSASSLELDKATEALRVAEADLSRVRSRFGWKDSQWIEVLSGLEEGQSVPVDTQTPSNNEQ